MDALQLSNLTKIYRGGLQALKGIDLKVEEGDFFALLGPNGAGKTTAIGIITSLVNKTAGKVEVFGHDIDNDFPTAKSCIGVVPQEFNFNGFETVEQIVVNQAGFYGVERKLATQRAEHYLSELSLWDKRSTRSRFLSGGMKRRLMIARALIHEPKLLILDEPTAGVDIELRRSMWEFLRRINERGTTIILTTHYLEEAENLCRDIAIIDRGKIVENTNMKALLKTLTKQSFVLDLQHPIETLPHMESCEARLLDPVTLEITVPATLSLTELFGKLQACGLSVMSMKNKSNRLEELFLTLVGDSRESQQAGGKA